jgi:anti-sigma-K factor RskA
MTSRPDDVALMTGSYAVDALDDHERAAVDAAVASSESLRSEVASLRETALLLAYAAEPVEPSGDLRSALMAKIATTPQLPALRGADTDTAPDAPTAATTAVPSVQEGRRAGVTDLTAPGTGRAGRTANARWFRRPAALVSAAAAVVILSGGVIGVHALGDQPSGPGQVQASTKLDQIYAASDFHRSSTSVRGGGTATVVWSDKVGKSAVIFKGVKAAPSGKTYQLWYIGSSIKAAGLVQSVDGGTTSAVLTGRKTSGDTIGITVEPAGGSEQPTTKPIVAVPTSA